MSGGALDYIQYKLDDAADTIRRSRPKDALLMAFAKHIDEIGIALHDIEWDLSGDSSLSEKEREYIRSLMKRDAEIDVLVEEGKRIRDDLTKMIAKKEFG